MQDLPKGGRTPSPKGASRVGLCGRGGGANSGGGAPIQALAPGRWRPSVRHCPAPPSRDPIYYRIGPVFE